MTLSAEFRFLMLAVRAAMPGGAPPRVDVDLVDWSEFVQLVDRHRVAGLVCAGLTRLAVAPPCKEALTERADHAARRELYTAFEASRLTSTFAAVGISALTLKGPALAARAFGRLGLRYNHDIDFLVSESEVSRAAEALENAGV
ncbi:MAG: nucleotidyltransferase family protein [Alphaproteobacteria bacterium]